MIKLLLINMADIQHVPTDKREYNKNPDLVGESDEEEIKLDSAISKEHARVYREYSENAIWEYRPP